ncbi:MAG: hypothetical protein HC845_00415 [Akkermansiaceae bacterium]|nr:hypothetical protein [Akkermansiaceae bacterium]
MSWFSTNYEKATLGGAVAVALGLAYLGFSKINGVDDDFGASPKGAGNNNTAVASAELVPKSIASLEVDRAWQQGVTPTGRAVDLFTGVPLFVPSATPDKPLDPITGPMIHDPIPNTWWLENRLDPGFADSPTRDPDKDGFSNMEEFKAKSNPNDPQSIPSLIAKLKYIKDESLAWVIVPGYPSEQGCDFRYENSKSQKIKTDIAKQVMPGENIFDLPPVKDRFKFLRTEVRKIMNERLKYESDVTFAVIEDQRPNKKGTLYEFQAPLSDQLFKENLKFDRTAIFSLEALGMSGKEFKVEEKTSFALPPENEKKDYFTKEVTPEAVTIEYTTPSGEKQSIQIGKGQMPAITE